MDLVDICTSNAYKKWWWTAKYLRVTVKIEETAELCNICALTHFTILGLFSSIITHKLGGKSFYDSAELCILWGLNYQKAALNGRIRDLPPHYLKLRINNWITCTSQHHSLLRTQVYWFIYHFWKTSVLNECDIYLII